MSVPRYYFALVGVLLAAGAVLVFGPWYTQQWAVTMLGALKLIGLYGACLFGFVAVSAHRPDDLQRRSWLLLSSGLAFYSAAQSVLFVYQAFLAVRIPFPSIGDPLFMLASILIALSLFLFCFTSLRTGLPLGRPLVFWSPALIVAVGFLASAWPILQPILTTGDPWEETALNVFYPVAGFVCLAPSLVMLRVGWLFRGGSLLWVWLPLTVGFACVLTSDILFSFLTALDMAWIEAAVDYLYIAGYVLIFMGAMTKAHLLRMAS